MAAMDPEERKAEQQRLVEEGDYAMTEELFGVEASGSVLKPVNRDEHEALGTILGTKLASCVGSYHFATTMKAVFKEALAEAKSDQIKEFVSALNVMASAKQKEEKAKTGKGKKAGKKSIQAVRDNYDEDVDIGLTTYGGGDAG